METQVWHGGLVGRVNSLTVDYGSSVNKERSQEARR